MTVLVGTETVLLAALALLVVGLLRSHAEILRHLNLTEDVVENEGAREAGESRYVPQRPLADPRMGVAADITGLTLEQAAISVSMRDRQFTGTLLAFLSSGCLTCYEFWSALTAPELPTGARAVIVTKDHTDESLAKIQELAPRETLVVLSSEAWSNYDVPGAPYFVWVESESGSIQGVGAATQWASVQKLLADSLAEASGASSDEWRDARDEADLIAAGIAPGHPSLNDPVPIAGDVT
jgi:hypothetical protein